MPTPSIASLFICRHNHIIKVLHSPPARLISPAVMPRVRKVNVPFKKAITNAQGNPTVAAANMVTIFERPKRQPGGSRGISGSIFSSIVKIMANAERRPQKATFFAARVACCLELCFFNIKSPGCAVDRRVNRGSYNAYDYPIRKAYGGIARLL